jgi:hypothetical protein
MRGGLYLENLKERKHLEDLVVDGRITLEWILKQWVGGGADSSGSIGKRGGIFFEHGNKYTNFIKCGVFLD